jgi:hypothetical protein
MYPKSYNKIFAMTTDFDGVCMSCLFGLPVIPNICTAQARVELTK